MKSISRRDFLKYSGTGLAGLAVAMHFPMFTPRRALASTGAWKFGVMSDTQWKQDYPNNGENPASCAVSIINALNREFVHHDCRFVIQVGDLADKESVNGVRTMPTRANAAQTLYNAGIGFFPLRGNHEASAIAANELPVQFPQTLGSGPNVFGAKNFDSPFDNLRGLSYSFDYENVRCVLIDQFIRADGSNYDGTTSYNNNAVDQVGWVDSMLRSRPSDSHAFVFSHKNLIGQNHKDVLFGKDLTSNPGPRDEFISSLCANGVRYQLGGHDHMHHRSIVKTGDGQSSVGQIITSSNSYKFYIPRSGDDGRETPLQQELFTVGYYIFTIDGPRVYVDFYSSSHGQDYGDTDLLASPGSFGFYLRESFGYSLNGKQFQVAHGETYTSVQDAFEGTTAKILGGTNGNTETDYLTRPLTKTVNTGWSAPSAQDSAVVASNILSLWGMADNLSLYDENLTGYLPSAAENNKSDVYTLSMTYDDARVNGLHLGTAGFRLATKDTDGKWIKAVDKNYGGGKKFVKGPCQPGYPLGTYGVDTATKTAWAVINYNSDFAVIAQYE